jgi:hypothetical protein
VLQAALRFFLPAGTDPAKPFLAFNATLRVEALPSPARPFFFTAVVTLKCLQGAMKMTPHDEAPA